MNCSGKEVHALWQFGQPRWLRTSRGVILYLYPQALQYKGIRVWLFLYFPPSMTVRFGSIWWRRSKNISIVRRCVSPRCKCAHWGQPLPLRIWAGVMSHSCPHFRNLNLTFWSAFTYLLIIITSSLLDFKSSTNSSWDFCLTPAHLAHPCPLNRLSAVGNHSYPHLPHFTAILEWPLL